MRYMAEAHEAPVLLIGHSLGGAAALVAAASADHIKAVATIGAPGDIGHIRHLFSGKLDRIAEEGQAEVSIGGRPFTIRKEFIEDLERQDLAEILENLRKPLLIAHSPQDNVVGIDNAAKLFHAARHPKSFLSLDGADHLLSTHADSLYAGHMIAAWATRYLPVSEPAAGPESTFSVVAHIGNEGYTTQLQAGRHALTADEPTQVGGNDLGPTPYDLLSAALGACTAMTMKMYAERKGWDLQGAYVRVDHDKIHVQDCEACDKSNTNKVDRFQREIELVGALDPEQRTRLLEIADKCPVHRTLQGEVEVLTTERVATS